MEYSKKPIVIREVWETNIEYEFALIQHIISDYPYISIDTEFPGLIFYPNQKHNLHNSHLNLTPSNTYFLMKTNVDALNMIQLGLTLSDPYGNLPDLGTNARYLWEFNFREFDIDKDLQNPDSVELLKRQGIDFLRNKKEGVRSEHFSRLFLRSLVYPMMNLTWVTFHGAYDFGYLVKLLTRSELPADLDSFMKLLWMFFGFSVYDMKLILKYCGLHGGLDRMAKSLEVDRVVGKKHQAGSDSLLTMQTFLKMKEIYFHGENFSFLNRFTFIPYGLNIEVGSESVYL